MKFRTFDDFARWTNSTHGQKYTLEQEANEFAGRLLVPLDRLRQELDSFAPALEKAMPHWFTSMDVRAAFAESAANFFKFPNKPLKPASTAKRFGPRVDILAPPILRSVTPPSTAATCRKVRHPLRHGWGEGRGEVSPCHLPSSIFHLRPSFSTLSPVQPDKLETLDDLLAQAEHYANFSMRNMGRLPPTLFMIGPDGTMMFMPESLGDDSEKDDFATNAKLMCIAHGATACVMAMEVWTKFATPGEELDETERPSEAIDRREFVILMGESHTAQKQKFLPIIRSGNGKFFGLGESEVPAMDTLTGRFAQILPTKVPDTDMRDLAKAMLKVKGAGRALPGITPRLPRSRR